VEVVVLKRALWIGIVLLAGLALAVSSQELLRLYHFDVDQADCTLLISPSGVSVLFDCGDAGWNSSRELREVAPHILSILGNRTLDYVVISHLNVDHVGYVGYGGLWGLIETYGVRPSNVLVRNYHAYRGDTSEKGFGQWASYLDGINPPAEVHIASLGEVIDLRDGVTLSICSIDANGYFEPSTELGCCPVSENELSLGVLVSYGAYQEWIGGDLGGTCTQRWFGSKCVQYYDIETAAASMIGDVEVLRVNHHGSRYSTNHTFLGNLDPEVSIISVGETKSYGHPDAGVLLRLAATSDVYLTTLGSKDGPIVERRVDLDALANIFPGVGLVLIETDGFSYWVNGKAYAASDPQRVDADGDGYFTEVDPDDTDPNAVPALNMEE
jgi:hypothetical protein